MASIFYQIGIGLFFCGMRVAALFNPKAEKWINGRKNWENMLLPFCNKCKQHPKEPIIWMHASSVGEFEQGRPIIEAIRKDFPGSHILISFFSPSGFEAAHNYPTADFITYLPLDQPANAEKFIRMVQPSLVLWIKYEYWYCFLQTLHQHKIPVLLISAIFQVRQPFFKWYGAAHRQMLHFFRHIFVQNGSSKDLLQKKVDTSRITVSGDTRFDRVAMLAQNWQPIPDLEPQIALFEKVVVAGSTWPDDEKALVHLVNKYPEVLWIIAPHHIDHASLKATAQKFPDALFFNDISGNNYKKNSNVLIMNTMGLLSRAYRYASISYIGGGFSATGIHNLLEPAVYGKPVLMGPNFEEYAEAVELMEAGGAFAAATPLQLEQLFDTMLKMDAPYQKACEAAAMYTQAKTGATQKVLAYIYKNRLLTN